MGWKVEMTSDSKTKLVADVKSGVVSADDILVIKRWIEDVENNGLEKAQMNPNWRDLYQEIVQ